MAMWGNLAIFLLFMTFILRPGLKIMRYYLFASDLSFMPLYNKLLIIIFYYISDMDSKVKYYFFSYCY